MKWSLALSHAEVMVMMVTVGELGLFLFSRFRKGLVGDGIGSNIYDC